MKLSAEQVLSKKKEILVAAAAIALSRKAYRSWKLDGEAITYDVSVWGEKTKAVFADVIDDSRRIAGRLAGRLILGPDNQIEDVELPEDSLDVDAGTLDALEAAVHDVDGWSGRTDENPLQNG